jgi:hypothetical protein
VKYAAMRFTAGEQKKYLCFELPYLPFDLSSQWTYGAAPVIAPSSRWAADQDAEGSQSIPARYRRRY